MLYDLGEQADGLVLMPQRNGLARRLFRDHDPLGEPVRVLEVMGHLTEKNGVEGPQRVGCPAVQPTSAGTAQGLVDRLGRQRVAEPERFAVFDQQAGADGFLQSLDSTRVLGDGQQNR